MSIQQIHPQNLPEKPLVSFIITTYNLPVQMLKECLKSILALSLNEQKREIILVDDGSEESPMPALADFQQYFIYIRQNNQGLSATRNIGLRNANGCYVQFVDGDDTIIPFAYEHCLDLARYRNADIVAFEMTQKRREKRDLTQAGPMTGSEYLNNYNIHAAACSYLFKKNILHGLLFTLNILHEDEEFTPQLILHADVLYKTNAEAYFYRQREESITHNHSKRAIIKKLDDTFNIIIRFQARIDTFPKLEQKALKRRIAQLTMDYLFNVARYTHSMKHMDRAIDRLNKRGLYPLPDKKYTRNYQLFRRLIQSKTGRRLIIAVTLR
ncbi:MAG: glycosyltransferase [Prevotella sp.]